MAKSPPPLKVCLACGQQLPQPIAEFIGDISICPKCWGVMSAAERCTRYEAVRTQRQLLAIKHAVENNEYLAKQTARLAKVLEALIREIKEPFQGFTDLVERWNARIEREDDEEEEWKRGRSDDDE